MDKILLYRIGDHYATFFQDTDVCRKYIDMKLLGKNYVGFEAGDLPKNIDLLTKNGNTVALCE